MLGVPSSVPFADMAAVLSGVVAERPAEDTSAVGELFGMRQEKITECGKCRAVTTTENLLLLTNLVYPEQSTLKQVDLAVTLPGRDHPDGLYSTVLC